MSILSSASGRIFGAPNSTMIAIFVFGAGVAKIRRIVFVGGFNHDLEVFVVSFRYIVAPITRFALCSCQAFFSYFQVGCFCFNRFGVVSRYVAAGIGQIVGSYDHRTKHYFYGSMCANCLRMRFLFRLFR